MNIGPTTVQRHDSGRTRRRGSVEIARTGRRRRRAANRHDDDGSAPAAAHGSNARRTVTNQTHLRRGATGHQRPQVRPAPAHPALASCTAALCRTILPSIECLEDSYVLRWLRAKDSRFDETADALKKHVVFRKAWELDSISSWEAPEVSRALQRVSPSGFVRFVIATQVTSSRVATVNNCETRGSGRTSSGSFPSPLSFAG